MNLSGHFAITDAATPAVEVLLQRCSPRRLASVLAPAMGRLWRERLVSLGTNKNGWPTTHFWRRAANSLSIQTSDDGVTLTVAQTGVRQRWLGGSISTVRAGALTIPISPLSYGKTAADFPNLTLIRTPKGVYLVQLPGSSSTARGVHRNKTNQSRVVGPPLFLFRLVQSVDQAGNPRVVPTNEEFAAAALTAIRTYEHLPSHP
jgi:hypothetical protein